MTPDERKDKIFSIFEDCHKALRHADGAHWTGESESGGHNEAWAAKEEAIAQLDALYANWFIQQIDNLENHYAYYLNHEVGKKRAKFAQELREQVTAGLKSKEGERK